MKQFWNWKKILALLLAIVFLVGGGLLVWQWKWNGWFSKPTEAAPPAVEFPMPDPIAIAPRDPNPPEVQNYGPNPDDFVKDEATGVEYVKGILVVLFERGSTEAQKQAALEAVKGEIVGRADIVGKWELRVPAADYAALQALCDQLKAMPGVSAAMPDHVVEIAAQAMPAGDPWTGGSYNTVVNNSKWAEVDRLPEAWSTYNAVTTNQVLLGMVDSGVNASHEELSGGIVSSLTTVNGFTPSYSYAVLPSYHGTAMAGIMAARMGNNKGGAGVAQNAKVYAVDFQAAKDSQTTRVTETVCYDGILTVARAGVHAINFSVGTISSGNNGTEVPDSHGYAAAQNLWSMISYGFDDFVIVQSAGNKRLESRLNGYFSSISPTNAQLTAAQTEMVMNRVIVAGALDCFSSPYKQVSYTAYGGPQMIYAPGSKIFAPNSGGNSAYQVLDGTSLAAPQITATAGWMFALNPSLDGGQVGQLLKMDAVSPPVVKDYSAVETATYRMLDCVRALESANMAFLESNHADVVIVQTQRYLLVPEKMAAGALSAALSAFNGTMSFTKAQDNPAFLAGTGDQIKVRSSGTTGLETTYTVVVKGDLSGDGRCDALDAQCLLGRAEGTWQPGYSEEIYTIALNGMTAQAMFDKGMQ